VLPHAELHHAPHSTLTMREDDAPSLANLSDLPPKPVGQRLLEGALRSGSRGRTPHSCSCPALTLDTTLLALDLLLLPHGHVGGLAVRELHASW